MLRRLAAALLLGLFAALPALGQELLEPEQAFKFSARALDGATVEVRFDIAEGYYLYKDKFKFAAEPAVQFGAAEFPAGKKKHDDFFGEEETYRDTILIKLPLAAAAAGGAFKLTVTSQGCADIGVCYSPQPQSANIVLAALSDAPPAGGGIGSRKCMAQNTACYPPDGKQLPLSEGLGRCPLKRYARTQR